MAASGAVPPPHGAPDAKVSGASYAEGNVADLMRLFYGRLFPFREMFTWLAYGNDARLPHSDATFFQRREFCFTLENDVFVRYQSFKDCAELHAAVRDRCPAKIDIGPIFNVDPQKRSAYGGLGSDRVFAPVERELVFDVDMTDYDDVRTCCSGGSICEKCWPFMTVAVKVVDRILRDDFGFRHLLWVYSGRRGIHCWVCDQRARQLTNEQRSSVAEFFSVCKGGDQGGKKVNLSFPLHPSLQRAYDEVLMDSWINVILPNHGLLETPAQLDAIIAMLPDEDLRATISDRFKSGKRLAPSREEEGALRWATLEREVEKAAKRSNPNDAAALRRCLCEIVFAYTFPRLDLEVSKHMNHLLKAPFCVHPKTGRVCVPINPALADDFDPLVVPTVAQLLNELNEQHASAQPAADAQPGEDYNRTSLRHAVQTFRETFLDALVKESHQALLHKAHDNQTTEW